MKLLGGNADFGTKTEFSAIRKPSGGIDINRRAVDGCGKALGIFQITGDNTLTVAGRICPDVLNCLI